MSEIDRRLIEREQQRRQQVEEERAEEESEIRMMVERIPPEATAALEVLEQRGGPGAELRKVDRSRSRFGFYKRRSEKRAAWRLCSVGYGNDGQSTYYWLLSDGSIARGDWLLYVHDLAESYATDVKYRNNPDWRTDERSATWAAIRGVYAGLQKLSGRSSND